MASKADFTINSSPSTFKTKRDQAWCVFAFDLEHSYTTRLGCQHDAKVVEVAGVAASRGEAVIRGLVVWFQVSPLLLLLPGTVIL